MNKIIVIRYSVMGDVVLTTPVIRAIIESNPELEMTIVTKEFYAPFFFGIPRVNLFFIDKDNRYKGLSGAYRLYKTLVAEGTPDAFIDLQGNLFSRTLSWFFERKGSKVSRIDNGEKEKQFLIKAKYIRALKHATTRYLDAFAAVGFDAKIGKAPFIDYSTEAYQTARSYFIGKIPEKSYLKIGLSPFAPTKPKVWGLNHFKELISLINQNHNAVFFLFGGGEKEILLMKELEQFGDNVHLIAGKFTLSEELAMMRMLDLMICMDSSNMHLASLSGIKTISIWGGTHPAFGFSALNQPSEYHIQTPVSSLKCRPCSEQGEKNCIYKEPKCMEMITAEAVFDSIRPIIARQSQQGSEK